MNSEELLQLKKKAGPGSGASSIRSGKSGYKHKVSSSHSATSAIVRDLISHIPDKEKPQAEKLTQKIKEIKEEQQFEQSSHIFEELILPHNRTKYYDGQEEEVSKALEEAKNRSLLRSNTTGIIQTAFTQQPKETIPKTEAIAKFQSKINTMVFAFRSLKKMYFPNDLYRIIYARQWKDFDREAVQMFNSAFLSSRVFVAKYIERLAYKELLGLESQLPRNFSIGFIEILVEQATGKYPGEIQNKVIQAVNALVRIPVFRAQLHPALHKLYEYYEKNLIFASNLSAFVTLFAELALFEDIDYQEFSLLDLFLQLMKEPLRNVAQAMEILDKQAPELAHMILFEEEEVKEEIKEESSANVSEKTTLNRKVSRKSSIASSTVRRLNTKNALMISQKTLHKNSDMAFNLSKPQKIHEMRKGYVDFINKKKRDRLKEITDLNQVDGKEIIIQAARGLSRLMLPCNSVSFISNTGTAKKMIYFELLERNLIEQFLKDPCMSEEKSEVKRCLTTIITMFVLQTTKDKTYKGQYLYNYLIEIHILDYLSAWSKDPDLVVRANSAWMFTALCVGGLVDPLDLTRYGIIRDMFVLYIKLYDEPASTTMISEEAENIAENILKMYDYENFLDSLGNILNRVAKIQHLIFATLIFLSIHKDKNIISTVHKTTKKEVDKSVEENALCGLMELLHKDSETMKLFIEILIQFTICDDEDFQKNGIWYLKHIIINSKLNQLVESQNVDILEVFIAGCVCESQDIQQECVNVLTYLAIEKKAYSKNKEDPLLDALMYLTGVQFDTIRGLAYNGLAALALHGKDAAPILLKQANQENYFEAITKKLKVFRKSFIERKYKRKTVAKYTGINLLLNLSRRATIKYQGKVCDRIPLILDTIAAQNQLSSEENMNEVGCLQAIRALMSSSQIDIKQQEVVPFIDRVSRDKSFRCCKIIINNKFVPWCLKLLEDSKDLGKTLETVNLLRFVLYQFYHEMSFEQEETSIRSLFKTLLSKFKWQESASTSRAVHERLVECFLLIFVRDKNIILAVTEEVLEQVELTLDTFKDRDSDTRLALSKHLSSTANLPQVQNKLLKKIPVTIATIKSYLLTGIYEEKFNATRLLSYLTRSPEFNNSAYEAGIFQILCDLITKLDAKDAMPLVCSLSNLLVFSKIRSTENECENFLIKGYFSSLLKLTKENGNHLLTEAFLDLLTKLLVEKEFSDKLFADKNYRVKDIITVLIRAIQHSKCETRSDTKCENNCETKDTMCEKCENLCDNFSSHRYKFFVNVYPVSLFIIKKYGFNVASQLIRLGKCHSKLKKHDVGQSAIEGLAEALKSFQNKRSIDPLCENLLCELCIYLQLHNGLLKDSTLSEKLLKINDEIIKIIIHEKASDLLKARAGALLLHSSLIAPINDDIDRLKTRIVHVMFTMSHAALPELINLSVWSLRQLYLKASNSNLKFDYQKVFVQSDAIKNLAPKLVLHNHKPLHENVLLCFGTLFEAQETKDIFFRYNEQLDHFRRIWDIGETAFIALIEDKANEEDLNLLSAFGFTMKMLVKGHKVAQDKVVKIEKIYEKKFDIFQISLKVLEKMIKGNSEVGVKICENFTELVKNFLENFELHPVFLATQSSIPHLQLLQKMLHSNSSPTYDQLKIDNNIVHCFALLAENPALKFHEDARMSEFTEFVRQLNNMYEKGQYLSKTEVDTHFTILKTLKKLIEIRSSKLGQQPTDDDREAFLQELSSLGGLDPLLFYEFSNVPSIREMATGTLDFLAPPS